MIIKHSPMPWATGRSDMATIVDGYESKWIYDARNRMIAVSSGMELFKWEEVMSNARLIAAAPELLEALNAVLDNYKALVDSGDAGNWDFEEMPCVKSARAALAKANPEGAK